MVCQIIEQRQLGYPRGHGQEVKEGAGRGAPARGGGGQDCQEEHQEEGRNPRILDGAVRSESRERRFRVFTRKFGKFFLFLTVH
jgi:hypothetical protein